PTNLMANAVEDRNGQSSGKQNAGVITPSALSDEPEAVVGYNIYRVPAPLPGQPAPTPEQIVQPANLVGSTTGNSSSFTDKVTTGNSGQSSGSGNYTYSATSFFGNGTQSSGSNTAGTDLPVIKNPKFNKGTIAIDAGGSFIAQQGAMLIVNDADAFPLQL